jgi:membrane fusion protein (multidrug efflux system)
MKLKYLILLAAFYSCSQKKEVTAPSPVRLPILTLSNSSVTTYQEYPAAIEGSDNIEIRPQVSGELQKVFVDEGAYVNSGDPLFKIDPKPYQAMLSNATASLHAAESASISANIEVEKLTNLFKTKVISEYQLKTAKANAGMANANVEQARATVATAKINLGYTLIRAPTSGYIGRLLKKKGSLVSPIDPAALTDLSDVRNVHVYFSFSEKDFVAFKAQYPGGTLSEKLKNLPDVTLLLSDNTEYSLPGRIDIIDGQFNKSTGAITVRANFQNQNGLLRSGNTGKIKLGLELHNIFLVPGSATIQIQDKTFVYALAKDNKVEKHAILIAGRSGTNYVVSDGIKNGDRIVINGIGGIKEGEVVNPEITVKTDLNKN